MLTTPTSPPHQLSAPAQPDLNPHSQPGPALAWRDLLLPTIFYSLLILLMAQSLLATFGRAVPVSTQRNLENDALLNLWVVAWASRTLLADPLRIFHGNIFYPEPYALAYTDHHLGVVPIFGPLWGLTGNPVAAFDLYYLLSFVLTGLATFAFLRLWISSLPAALVAGLLFAFAPPRLSIHYNTQLLAIWWIPLTLFFTERLLRQPTFGRAILAALSYAMQWLSAIYPSWHLSITLLIYLLAAAIREPALFGPRLWRSTIPAALLALLLFVPPLIPYKLVSDRWAFEWPIQHLVSHSAQFASFLNVSPGNLLYGRLLRDVGGPVGTPQELFLGLSPLLLSLLAVLCLARRRQPSPSPRGLRWLMLTMAAIGLVALLLSFGPYLPTSPPIPLPYLQLIEWVPGFHVMRNPVRFVFVLILALAVLSGLGVAVLLERVRNNTTRRVVAAAVLLLVSLEVFTVLPFERVPEFDQPALAYLAASSEQGPIVDFPLSWESGAAQSPRMVSTIAHWRPMVGGFSGFKPPRDAMESVLEGAEPLVVGDALQALGISTVVVHLDELRSANRQRYTRSDWREAGFEEQFRSERTLIWSLQPRRSPRLVDRYEAEIQAPRQVSALAALSIRLLCEVQTGEIFRDPTGGARSVVADWRPADSSARPHQQVIRTTLPSIVAPRPAVKAEFDLQAPPTPGRYKLVLSGDHFSAERDVIVARRSG